MTPNSQRIAVPSLMSCLGLLMPSAVSAQKVKLENVAFHEVLDRLFGTELLDGKARFRFVADGVVLNSDQIARFFVSADESASDFADLMTGQTRGEELRIRSLLADEPFEFKLSGSQITLDGVSLTQAQLDALVEELRGISELHEARIQAIVDGKPLVVKLENAASQDLG